MKVSDLLVDTGNDFSADVANAMLGRTRLVRLNYIARLCPPLSLEALCLAIPESKAAKDPNVYIRFTELLNEIDPGSQLSVPDVEWVERRKKENQRETERLEHELRGYKNNLIKESIRVSHRSQRWLSTDVLTRMVLDGTRRSRHTLHVCVRHRTILKSLPKDERVLHDPQTHC